MTEGRSKKLPPGYDGDSNISNGINPQDLDFDLRAPGQAPRDYHLPWVDSGPVDFSSPRVVRTTNALTTSTIVNNSNTENVFIKQSPSSPLAPVLPANYFSSPRRPSWSTRPYSLPLNAGTAFTNPFHPIQPIQRPRPYSMIGTEHDPFRATFNPPAPLQHNPFLPSNVVTPAFSNPDPLQDLDDMPLADYTPGPPSPANARRQFSADIEDYMQDSDEPSVKDELEDDDEDEDIGDSNELVNTPATCLTIPSQPPSTGRTTGQRCAAVNKFPGYPANSVNPPEDLSCYEFCQQYPASLHGQNLLPFLQRRWSAEEIFNCLPSDVQQYVLDRPVAQTTMYLYKRLQVIELQLKRPDYTQFLDLMNSEKLRIDGRPDGVISLQSIYSPTEAWRVRHRTGVDPKTRRYVQLPGVSSTNFGRARDQARANCPELLDPIPFDMDTQPPPVPTQSSTFSPSTSAPPSTAPRTRTGRHRKARTATKNTQQAGQAQSTSTPTPTVATTTVPQTRTRPPTTSSQLRASNASNDRIPTLESMFPSGMINVPGAYVRTLSPGGTRIWHGAPSPEFVDSWFRQGHRRFWLDVNLPDAYVPSPSPTPSSAAGASQEQGEMVAISTDMQVELNDRFVEDTIEATEAVSGRTGLGAAERMAVDGSKKRKARMMVGEAEPLPDQAEVKVKRARKGKGEVVNEDDDEAEIERLLLGEDGSSVSTRSVLSGRQS